MASPTKVLEQARRRQPEAGLFTNRAFMLLWAAYGISAMGDHISEMAVLSFMDAMHSPELTRLQAMITFMFMFPFFVLGPFNGILADRLPRRAIMVFADVVRAVLMLNFALLLGWFSPWGTVWTFMPLLIVGVFAALFSPARSALLPNLIREDQLVRANAMTSGLGVIATMLAVAIGGYLADRYRPQVSFTIDAATFVASAVLLMLIRVPAGRTTRASTHAGPAALAEATTYIWRHRRVAQLIAVALVVWACGATVRSTIPAMVRDVYQRHEYFEMTLFQARLGAGMLTGALILTALGDALRSEIAITWSLLGIALSIGLLAATALVPMPVGLAYHLGGASIILSGVFAAGVMSSYNALLQRIVPDRLRGRLFGLTDLVTMAGLLTATGLIGIPRWGNIDRWIGWMLLGVTAVVLATAVASLWIRLKSGRLPAGRRFWWNLNEFYCKWWFRLRRDGPCTIPAEGPVIVVANHTCGIDPLLLIAGTPHRLIGFLIAEEYSRIPIAGRLIRMIGCVPVRRDGHDAAGTRAALRHLREGNVLGIFIEGGIPEPGEVREPKLGAAMLALHSGALIVPAHISGTRYDENIAWSFLRRHKARVRFGKPIDLGRYWIPSGDKEALRKASYKLLERIRALAPRPEADDRAPAGDLA